MQQKGAASSSFSQLKALEGLLFSPLPCLFGVNLRPGEGLMCSLIPRRTCKTRTCSWLPPLPSGTHTSCPCSGQGGPPLKTLTPGMGRAAEHVEPRVFTGERAGQALTPLGALPGPPHPAPSAQRQASPFGVFSHHPHFLLHPCLGSARPGSRPRQWVLAPRLGAGCLGQS